MSVVFTFVAPAKADQQRPASRERVAGNEITPALVWRAGFQSLLYDEGAKPLGAVDLAFVKNVEPLQIALTHGAGELDPVTAARRLAALQLRGNGCLALRVPARGLVDTDQQPSHIAFWRRADEYLTLLKRLWANEKPIDHEGPFYSVTGGFVPRKGVRGITMPIRVGGLSGTALNVAGKHADVFELAAVSPDEARLLAGRVRFAAARHGRQGKVRFALPVVFDAAGQGKADPDQVVLSRQPAQAALQLLSLVDAGISEFMVKGLAAVEDLDAFEHVVAFVQNSSSRREAAWAASAGAAVSHFDRVSARNY
ncbi:LLM class flavin-dependent oxidoreductase [Mesorhizobium loti]|nr:LLM class flavin-dependent oxidoreductase [Mesorhizobium loti]PLP58842.1 LLM class flavin-dependent oxidoreductase [Mesorhizobium loti]